MIRIIVEKPDVLPEQMSIEKDVIVIGRSSDCTLPVTDTRASRMHCQLVRGPQGVEVIDMGSSNGTMVNGRKVDRLLLKPGDRVEIGQTAIIWAGDGYRPGAPPKVVSEAALEDTPAAIPVEEILEKEAAQRPASGMTPSGRKLVRSSARLPAASTRSKVFQFATFAVILALFLIPVYVWVILPGKASVGQQGPSKLRSSDLDASDPEFAEFEKLDAQRREEIAKREAELKREAEERWKRDQGHAEGIAADTARREADERKKAEEARIAEEAKKASETEEQKKRRAEQAAQFQVEKKAFEAMSPEVGELLKKLNFPVASERVRGFQAAAKTEAAMELALVRADEIAAMNASFTRMWQNLKPGTQISFGDRTVKVRSANAEGFTGDSSGASFGKKWATLDPSDIADLFEWQGMTAEDRYGLGLLCFEIGLTEQAEAQLAECLKLDPGRKMLLDIVVARARGIEKPPAGFIVHEGAWLTADEKSLYDKGLRRLNGKWMTEDEINLAKGLVKVGDDWMTPEEAREKEKMDRLVSKIAPKGYIDQPGWYDGTPWSEAIVFETEHYKIKSNLKPEAVKDAGYIMEWLYLNFCRIFKFNKRMQKFEVWIGGSRQDYLTYGEGNERALGHCTSGGVISTFYQTNMTLLVLMHEGTHQFLFRLAPNCPLWMHEGMATFFECSKFKVDVKRKVLTLQTGLLNKNRLFVIQRDLKSGNAVSLDTFVRGQGGDPYSQGWSFVYFAVNYKKGMYARYWLDFIKDVGKGDNPMKWFKKWMGISDLKAFEEEWKKFILELDPNAAEDINLEHK